MSVSQANGAHTYTYENQFALVEGVIALICRRNLLTAVEAQDFSQEVHMKLIETRKIERFRGGSSLRTFLVIVIHNLYRDFRNHHWGKWRPSVEAQKAGPAAIRLEELIIRDGLTFEEAFETLRTNHGVTMPRQELEAIAARLPLRVNRKAQSDDVLVVMPSRGPLPDAVVLREEYQVRAARLREVLQAALRDLDAVDRLIVKYRFVDGLQIVQIAPLVQIDQKRLYRRLERIIKDLRRHFEDEGIDSGDIFDDDDEGD